MKQELIADPGPDEFSRIRRFFELGKSRPADFRRQQLLALKTAIIKHEQAIYAALYADLKKSPEESYATENGLLMAEINTALKNLDRWMRPEPRATNLVNFPSRSKVYRDPLGVVLIIAPWNYPFQLALIPLVGAIAGGNCAVIKPSELAPATAALIEKIMMEIYSPEYIYVKLGPGADIIPAMIRFFHFDHIFYTGSIPVGKAIYRQAAEDLVPVTLELGGKSPAIIENDAKIHVAARRIAVAKFTNAGQTCVAPDYVLVHHSIQDAFIEEMKKTILDFYGEYPENNEAYGRIVHENRFDKLAGYLGEGEVIFGGRLNRSTLFISPTIMRNVSLDAPLMKEEIFGPILPVFPFGSMKEAMEMINLNPKPLSLYLFTGDKIKEKAWISSMAFGGGCVNNAGWQFANHHLPFGGVGLSGIGAYHGKYSFLLFTHAKAIMKTPVWPDISLKYPPFKGKLKLFKKIIR